MYIIVVGAGRVGFHLSKALVNAGHEVVVIEKDAKKSEALSDQLGNICIRGDASEPVVLREAGASRADVFVASTGSDEDNLVACQMARHKFKVARTISVVNNPENEALFRQLGIDVTISSTQLILSSVQEELPARSQVHVVPISGNRQILYVEIPPDAAVAGTLISEIPLPPETIISAVIDRDGSLKDVDGEEAIEAYDHIVIVTIPDSARVVIDTLTTER